MTSTKIKCRCEIKKGDRSLYQVRWIAFVKILAILMLVLASHQLSDIRKSRKEFKALTKTSSSYLKTNSSESTKDASDDMTNSSESTKDESEDIWKITHYLIIDETDDNEKKTVNNNVNKNEEKNVNNTVHNNVNNNANNTVNNTVNNNVNNNEKKNGLEEKKNETNEKEKLNNSDKIISIDKDGTKKIEQNVIDSTNKTITNNTDTVSYLRGKKEDEDKNENTSTNSNNKKDEDKNMNTSTSSSSNKTKEEEK